MSDTDRHPPEHVLAELAEDASPENEELSGAYAHLRDCESCQAVVTQLEDVKHLLHALPSRLPTPPSVSARLTEALTAEAESASDHVTDQVAESTEASVTSIHDRPVAWFRRRLPQTLAAAASAAVIGLVGYTFVAGESPPDFSSAGGGDDSAETEATDGVMADQPAMESAPAEAEAREEENSDDSTDDDAGDADQSVGTTALRALPEDTLVLAVIGVWESGDEIAPRCGAALADDLGVDLVGSTYVEDEILAVVENDDQLTGWVIPECGAGVDGAEELVDTPVPGS